MGLVLFIIAVILVVAGIVALTRKELVKGLVLIVVGFIVGPGGYSIFNAVAGPGLFDHFG